MKALDKVFDTQVITRHYWVEFHFIEAKKIYLYEEGKKTDKRRYQSYNRYRRNPTEFIKG